MTELGQWSTSSLYFTEKPSLKTQNSLIYELQETPGQKRNSNNLHIIIIIIIVFSKPEMYDTAGSSNMSTVKLLLKRVCKYKQ